MHGPRRRNPKPPKPTADQTPTTSHPSHPLQACLMHLCRFFGSSSFVIFCLELSAPRLGLRSHGQAWKMLRACSGDIKVTGFFPTPLTCTLITAKKLCRGQEARSPWTGHGTWALVSLEGEGRRGEGGGEQSSDRTWGICLERLAGHR